MKHWNIAHWNQPVLTNFLRKFVNFEEICLFDLLQKYLHKKTSKKKKKIKYDVRVEWDKRKIYRVYSIAISSSFLSIRGIESSKQARAVCEIEIETD